MANSPLQRRQVLYSGNVQGVGFRYTTRMIARRFEVAGYVRNLPDRRVELVAEGPKEQIDDFLKAISERMSDQIRSLDSDTRPPIKGGADAEFADFEIRY